MMEGGDGGRSSLGQWARACSGGRAAFRADGTRARRLCAQACSMRAYRMRQRESVDMTPEKASNNAVDSLSKLMGEVGPKLRQGGGSGCRLEGDLVGRVEAAMVSLSTLTHSVADFDKGALLHRHFISTVSKREQPKYVGLVLPEVPESKALGQKPGRTHLTFVNQRTAPTNPWPNTGRLQAPLPCGGPAV